MATDTINSNDTQTCSESYDDLLRISGTNCTPSVWAQSFTYDSFGNITKCGSITWNPGYDLTNNNRYKTPQTGIIYDARGGLTSDTFHTYSYDVDGRPLSVDTISATYDALGREVEITSGSTHN